MKSKILTTGAVLLTLCAVPARADESPEAIKAAAENISPAPMEIRIPLPPKVKTRLTDEELRRFVSIATNIINNHPRGPLEIFDDGSDFRLLECVGYKMKDGFFALQAISLKILHPSVPDRNFPLHAFQIKPDGALADAIYQSAGISIEDRRMQYVIKEELAFWTK